MDVIPHEIADIVRKPLKHVPDARRAIEDTVGYKSLNDAIINSQDIRAGILREVKPENLLFVFSQVLEALRDALQELPLLNLSTDEGQYLACDIHREKANGRNKSKPEPCAIILCKLLESESCEKLLATKKKKGSSNAYRYEITWRELDKIQSAFEVISHSISSPNV